MQIYNDNGIPTYLALEKFVIVILNKHYNN